MTKNDYNGWTNYETWLVNLWQDNERADYEYWKGEARDIVIGVEEKSHIRVMADRMKEHYEEGAAQLTGVTGFWADLMGAALSEVNWFEIAKHWIDEAKEQNKAA